MFTISTALLFKQRPLKTKLHVLKNSPTESTVDIEQIQAAEVICNPVSCRVVGRFEARSELRGGPSFRSKRAELVSTDEFFDESIYFIKIAMSSASSDIFLKKFRKEKTVGLFVRSQNQIKHQQFTVSFRADERSLFP